MRHAEIEIARAIVRQTLARKCLVIVENCEWTGHECDLLAVTADLRVIDVEIKISSRDLRADADKAKWWDRYVRWEARDLDTVLPAPRRWPRRVWKHYYAFPVDLWDDDLLASIASPASGVVLVRENARGFAIAEVARRATPNPNAYRLSPEDVVDVARLASLRLWEAYAALAARPVPPVAGDADRALAALVELERVKRRIEAGTAAESERRAYADGKDSAWLEAERVVDAILRS